jgi:palmitoyltransferase
MNGSDQQPNQWFEAVKNGSLKELYDLLQQGEHIQQVDETGQNALHRAAQYGHLEVVHFLIINGLDPNLPDQKDGSIALHWAVVNNKIEVVRYLLAGGADPLEKTSRSVNALHLASGLGHDEPLLALLDKCDNKTWKSLDDQGRDPIRVAEQNNQIHVARYLRKYRKLNTTLSPIGWSLIGPLLIMLLGIAPSHPWISLTIFGALIGYSASPFAPILLSGHKGYYFFFGLVYCSLAVDLVHAFRFYGLSAFFCFRICLTLVAGTFYALAIFSDPGIHQVDKTKDNQEFINQIKSGDVSVKICHTCRIRRSARAKHCHQVDGCVRRFDHFCVWICNAVGAGNHLYFILFVTFIIPTQFFVALMHFQIISKIVDMNLSVSESLYHLWVQPLVPFLFVFAVVGLWQIPLLASQLHGIANGMTAYEKMVAAKRQHGECHGATCNHFSAKKKSSVLQHINDFLFNCNEVRY